MGDALTFLPLLLPSVAFHTMLEKMLPAHSADADETASSEESNL